MHAISILLAVAFATGSSAAGPDPEVVARDLNAGLLGVMKDGTTLDYQGRFDRIAPVVDEAFDVPFMAEKSLGRHWDELSAEDRRGWIALFREFMIANYAGRFTDYKDESFEQLGKEDGAYETVMVKTRLLVPSDQNVDLDYRLRETPDGWRVVDIYLKGSVSELALRRSDYSAVVKRGGYAELSTYLRGKIDALRTGTVE